MGNFIDLTRQVFGKLTVLSLTEKSNDKKPQIQWLCKCDCGNFTIVRSNTLKRGETKSCGCIRRNTAIQNILINKKHGWSQTKFYDVWRHILDRCLNPNDPSYKHYGGRGIQICERWKNFDNFKDDMYSTYDSSLSIERINNDGNYEPNNCKWATRKEQCRNRRTSSYLEYNGEKKTIAEWCEIFKMADSTLYNRLKRGWSIEKTLTYPIRYKK